MAKPAALDNVSGHVSDTCPDVIDKMRVRCDSFRREEHKIGSRELDDRGLAQAAQQPILERPRCCTRHSLCVQCLARLGAPLAVETKVSP